MDKLKKNFNRLLNNAKAYAKGLSERERYLLLAAAVTSSLVCIYFFLSFVFGVFSHFSQQFEDLQRARKNLEIGTVILRDVVQLKSRQQEIEKRAGTIKSEESPLSYLESAIREKTGLTAPQAFRVTPGQTLAITDDYEQIPYIISFDIKDLDPVVALLREITDGPQAVMVSGIDLRYFQGQDIIKVEIRTTSIRGAGGEMAQVAE